jgi:hypothetical protein
MMVRSCGLALAGVVGALLLTGCGAVTVQIPVDLGTGGEFDVEAGTPVSKTSSSTFDTGGITVGGGSVQLDPEVISVDGTTAKMLQDGTCAQACELAGVADATCDQVCVEGNLIVSVAVGTFDEVATVCTTGDQYGPFTVEIDENGDAVSVTPSSATLQDKTIAALNAGQASFCVEVISPITGTVVVGNILLNAGL